MLPGIISFLLVGLITIIIKNGFDFPEIKVTNLLSENSDVLKSQVAEHKIKRQVLREELAQTFKNSDEFKALTNEKVRGDFCRKFIENSENQIYIYAFKHETMGYKVEFLYFIEDLYKRYKEDEKKKKIENNNRFMNGDYDVSK